MVKSCGRVKIRKHGELLDIIENLKTQQNRLMTSMESQNKMINESRRRFRTSS